MSTTMFEEDYPRHSSRGESSEPMLSSPDDNRDHDNNDDSSGKKSLWLAQVPFVTAASLFGVGVLIALMGLAFWWLLFAPSPSTNVQEAAEIITEDLTETMSTATAFTVSNSSNASVLTVETSEGTCKVFRSLPNGQYQAIESEGRLDAGPMRFLPLNYHRAFPAGDSEDPTFEYHHSPEQLQHGVYVNLSVGNANPDSEASVDVSGDYSANMDTGDESFCF